ncbi:MAG: ACT domain-containing protein, partial [Candidatus Didemnitutus sp.]|nr:ACT domain-containing protein [Candidatus Didemnitutus sp.]
ADEIAAHFNLLPDRYFAQTGELDVALHLTMVNQLLRNISGADSLGSLRPVIEWRDDPDRECHSAHIVTWDRGGLFYKLAGALSVAGFNILSARITTRTDHIAIDSFEVAAPAQNAESFRAEFTRAVESALVANQDLGAAISAQASHFAVTESSRIPSVEAYLEISQPRVIIEVHAPDRFGLLYRVGRVIAENGFSLTAARVHTERGLAYDQFDLDPSDDRAVDVARLTGLRDELLRALGAAS